jgi:hypothetical protein
VIAQRAILGAKDPSDIFIPTARSRPSQERSWRSIAVGLRQRIRLADPSWLAWLAGLTAFLAGLCWYFAVFLSREQIQLVSNIVGNLLILSRHRRDSSPAPLYRKANVLRGLHRGREGRDPDLAHDHPVPGGDAGGDRGAAQFRRARHAGGCRGVGAGGHGPERRFRPSLPTALMKSISGSGARAMAIEAMKSYGVDSFVGRLVSILQGSSDTTFYIIALYFGAVGITRTRYAVTYGLLADLAAVVASVGVAYLFFH